MLESLDNPIWIALATNRSELDFLARRLKQVEAMMAEENL
jgi:hypothetical protein